VPSISPTSDHQTWHGDALAKVQAPTTVGLLAAAVPHLLEYHSQPPQVAQAPGAPT
jgi:hypothetical protein